MRMKHRWIGGLAIAAALTLGACAPTQQGADESAAPSQAAENSSAAPVPTPAPAEANESAEPTTDGYEY